MPEYAATFGEQPLPVNSPNAAVYAGRNEEGSFN
jgi:hypothetical protein